MVLEAGVQFFDHRIGQSGRTDRYDWGEAVGEATQVAQLCLAEVFHHRILSEDIIKLAIISTP